MHNVSVGHHRPGSSPCTSIRTFIIGHLSFIARLALLLGVALSTQPLPAARASHTNPIYVNDNASGANNGRSWPNAYRDLQDALLHAESGDEIWVAAGTYRPGTTRSDTFQLESGVAIYGGFAGGETARAQRDWQVNITILSGEIGEPFVNEDNSYHVVTGSGTGASAILDGVTISRGYANVAANLGDQGGGMLNDSGSPSLANVTFSRNWATFGGGLSNLGNSSPTLANVTFSSNSANYGAGMWNTDNSKPTLANVIFTGNLADYGGGMYNAVNGTPALANVTFSGNSAGPEGGGAMYNSVNSSPTVYNSILWGNSGGEIATAVATAPPVVQYSLVQNGYSGSGNIAGDPRFVDADGADNVPGTPDDRLRLRSNSPAVDAGRNSLVRNDTLDLDGDGNTAERLPLDHGGARRFLDVPATADTGAGNAPIVDMGAFEASPII
ncbi:MAG TPA: right-handed parallel beta-helix repeat-containing protein, partial [Bryobacteraceae bacterium]|nr:right-handed parallel beta-helix repeat-containing protein [Bryobacteraceae bacterium]